MKEDRGEVGYIKNFEHQIQKIKVCKKSKNTLLYVLSVAYVTQYAPLI